MGAASCTSCAKRPVMRCGRCNNTRCEAHALEAGERCDRCERDWQEDGVTRSAAKLIFAPPVAIFVGGVLFGLLLPISLGGILGAGVRCDRCGRDWQEDGVTRSAAKLIFAPPVAIFVGGVLFGLLLPISLG